MLTCRDASKLASEAHDRPLTLRERWGLAMHLVVCSLCRRYAAQIDFVRRAAAKLRTAEPAGREGLSAEARERIRRRLEER